MPRVRVGALELAYETDGEGDPLLLLMGLGGEHHGWDLLRPELVRRHRLVLLDNRDAGVSDEATGPYGIGVMDQLGIERFHLLGASMGGAIAQQVALQAPYRVAAMVLVATWARTDGFLRAIFGGWRRLAERVPAEELLAAMLPWAFTPRFFAEPPAELVAWQAGARARGLFKSVAAFQRQVDACLGHDTLDLLPILRTPTLVLAGEDDILTPPRYGRALAAALVTAEVMLVPGSGHACFLETPRAVAERALRFLARHPIRTG